MSFCGVATGGRLGPRGGSPPNPDGCRRYRPLMRAPADRSTRSAIAPSAKVRAGERRAPQPAKRARRRGAEQQPRASYETATVDDSERAQRDDPSALDRAPRLARVHARLHCRGDVRPVRRRSCSSSCSARDASSRIFARRGRDFYSATVEPRMADPAWTKIGRRAVGLAVATPLTVLYKFQRQDERAELAPRG